MRPYRIIQLAFCLALAHLFLAFVPYYFVASPLTASVGFASYYGMASLLHTAGLPIIGKFEEGMFMAPVTWFGECAIYGSWLLVHLGLAAAVELIRTRRPLR